MGANWCEWSRPTDRLPSDHVPFYRRRESGLCTFMYVRVSECGRARVREREYYVLTSSSSSGDAFCCCWLFFLRALLVALDDGCGRTERWLLSQRFSVAFTALHNAVLTRKGRRRRVVSSSV